MPNRSAHCFGFPTIMVDGRPVKIERRKSMALLVFLLVGTKSEGAAKTTVSDMLWPGMDRAESGWSLSNALGDLRDALGERVVVEVDNRLYVGESFYVDVQAFETLAGIRGDPPDLVNGQEDQLSEAAALYHGDFLSGFSLGDAPVFDLWQMDVADRLRSGLLLVLQYLAESYARSGQWDAAVAVTRRWITLSPLYEPAHYALMRYLAAADQRGAAQRVYEDFARILNDEMELEPSPEMEADYLALRAGRSSGAGSLGLEQRAFARVDDHRLPERSEPVLFGLQQPSKLAETAPVERGSAPAVNAAIPGLARLPEPGTPFVGRQEELERMIHLLANPSARMITLAGPGGSGKTRLAIEALRRLVESGKASQMYPDGIHYVPLASIQRADDAIQVISSVLAFPLPGGVSAADGQALLAHYLAERRCLLILDNLEHLMPGITWVADLLSAATGLKLLLTTRQRFNMPVEYVLEVEGMPVPSLRERIGIEGYSSVQLFLACAGRTQVGFQVGPADWPAVARICQLVEGLPLGIELAAAWVRMFTPDQIADSIEHNLDFLASERGLQPERHQSLRAVFEYSWRLLTERERSAYRKLAVFHVDFSPNAAAQVAGAPLPLLADLLDRSLLRRSASAAGRYELHGVLAQFAREKLTEEAYDQADALDFHRAYYLGILIDSFYEMKGPRQAAALHELEIEADHIEQAWQRALEERRYLDLQRAAPPLILFYEAGPRRGQALAVFEAAHECVAALRPGEFDSPARRALLALLTAAHKRFLFGQVDNALNLQLHLAAVESANRLPDSLDKAFALLVANVGPTSLEPAKIASQLGEAIRIFESLNDRWSEAMAHLVLGDNAVYHIKDLDLAVRSYRRSQEAFQRLGHDWGCALCLSGLANAALVRGDLLEAARLWQDSLVLYQKTHDLWRQVDVREAVSSVLERLGRNSEALACLEQNVHLLENLGASTNLGWTFARMAHLAMIMPAEVAESLPGDIQTQQYFQRAMDIFHSLGDEDNIRRLQELAASWSQAA